MDDYPYRAHDLPIFSRGHKNVYRRTFSEDRPRLEEVFLAISGRPVLRSLYFLISKKNVYRRTFSADRPRLEDVFLRYQEDPCFVVYSF